MRDVLASQCLALDPLKVRRIDVEGALGPGVTAKDVVLEIIRRLGVNGGAGFAYEYGGSAVEAMSMEERMTLCNMSIEGAARAGYVNPDETTFAYLEGRPFAPMGDAWDAAVERWRSLASDADAAYDDRFRLDAAGIEPNVTWGINPGQSVRVSGRVPRPADVSDGQRASVVEAPAYLGCAGGAPNLFRHAAGLSRCGLIHVLRRHADFPSGSPRPLRGYCA